jgi:tRNA 2-selenouridine synthase
VPSPLPIARFLAAGLPVIDVRSPGEFAQGHIPGATNLPLFTDAERARVGTLYKQEGRNAAMLEGLRITGPKLADIVEQAWTIAPEGKVGVHCLRGGERSASVAWLLEKAGFSQVVTLAKGYKAFREHVLSSFALPWNLIVLGGYTGTGKTELIRLLRGLGEAVVDLEALARHKGSSYGGIGEGVQPSTEQFENLLWKELDRLGQGCPIWVEDESQMIGRVKVPDAFFASMRAAEICFVDMPKEDRALRLMADYGSFPKVELAEATVRIQKKLGPQHAKEALDALEAGDLFRVAMITLTYYDKTYARGLSGRAPQRTRLIPANGKDMAALAQRLKHERNTAAQGALDRI